MTRALHWPLSLALLLGLAACGGDEIEGDDEVGDEDELFSSHPAASPAQIDLILVIDDSPSMREHQSTLAANMRAIGELLDTPEWLALDVRVAVTTTSVPGPTCSGDFAQGGELLTDSCSSLPEQAFVGPSEFDPGSSDLSEVCTQACALPEVSRRPSPAEALDANLATRPWFESKSNSYGGNLEEGTTLADALPCVGLRGFGGCEFESPLAALERLLERVNSPGDIAEGFLREQASLAVIFIGDEDDCSHPEGSATIFDPLGERVFWSDPDADAPTSALCHAASTSCDAQGCELVDRGLDGAITTNPDEAALSAMAGFSSTLATLMAQRPVYVGVLGGFGSDGVLRWPELDTPAAEDWTATFGWPWACESGSRRAQPQARMAALAELEALDEHSNFDFGGFSLCDEDWSVALGLNLVGPTQLSPWCGPAEPVGECELVARLADDSLVAIEPCLRDEQGWVVDPETSSYALPEGVDFCFVSLDDASGATEVSSDDMDIECVDAGAAIQFEISGRVDSLPWPPGTVYEATCERG
ncbi:hypothetical protein G6O69_22075 [Pseudenhygromyxa sp. WMMC2535]|uniref:hypothetical protein n=1 Tax=Pseudenhygromyxa sp. WMMC2535 TaxID=2712867 RepID=UPI00155607F7|nr:hypothetical protein [Pseudenhygromyxa sp. WMMC2535]NVB40545.1 hypothetical protein [Pseudenhygromyxa sp. WMMC2535]